MITNLATKLVMWLHTSGMVERKDIPIYVYVTHNLIFSIIPILMILGVGIVFNMILEGILFIIPFVMLRNFCGGYHFNSRYLCLVFSVMVLSAYMLLIRVIMYHEVFFGVIPLTVLSGGQLYLCSPIDSQKRKLTCKEVFFFKKTARIITESIFGILVLLVHFKVWRIAVPLSMGLNLTAVLQIPCAIKYALIEKRNKNIKGL